jgi:hypothetical protein
MQDPEVALYVTGMKRMFDEAVVGTLPVLPGIQIPKELTQVREIAGGGGCRSEERCFSA